MLASSDRSNPDHGGIVQVDDTGRMYIDVVLHNQQDATETPLDDAWEDLTPSAAYTLCVRKPPPGVARRGLEVVEDTPNGMVVHRRKLNWWEDLSLIHI